MAFCLHVSYVFAFLMKEKSAENVIQAHLSGILANKGGSRAMLSDNNTEFKNKVLHEACNQLGIKRLFCNQFHLQGNAKVKNVHNFLKWTLTTFLASSDLEWDEIPPFACYCYNIFPATESAFFLMFGQYPAERCLTHLSNSNRYYGTNKVKIVLKEPY